MVHRRKAQLIRDLAGTDKETQDAVLVGLDANDRREILRRLGLDDKDSN
jgi:hypothetical protein